MPPAPFVAVCPSESVKQSLCSLPFIAAAANPSPNSMPLTPGIENARWAISDSRESKNGSPNPAGTPVQVHSTTPPTEFPSAIAASRAFSHCAGSERPATWVIVALNSIPEAIFLATTPAATNVRVSLPEKCPPPLISLKPPCFTEAVKSAWPGRGDSLNSE